MITKILEFLKDDTDSFSCMRLMIIIVLFLFMGTWCYICFSTGTFINLSLGDVVLLLGLFAGKIGQKYVEDKSKLKVDNRVI